MSNLFIQIYSDGGGMESIKHVKGVGRNLLKFGNLWYTNTNNLHAKQFLPTVEETELCNRVVNTPVSYSGGKSEAAPLRNAIAKGERKYSSYSFATRLV
jgi:hypothetical protein